MRADLHTHTVFSDGELIPAELVRRAMVLGHDMIAITDHVDMTNVEFVASNVAKAVELCEDYIRVIPGVEITHVPPSKIDHVAKLARRNGAEWIVVHGETVTEPVAPGTNRASVESPEVDGKIYFTAEREIPAGTFVPVRITGVMDGELTGELAE